MTQKSTIFYLLFAFLFFSLIASPATATILVIVPHPDDEVLLTAGVIYNSVLRSETVKIVYVTNGDYAGGPTDEGLVRQAEAVASASYLGISNENNLIFLGYPDGYLKTVYDSYPLQTDVFTTPVYLQSTTYGNRGLNSSDYHYYITGNTSHANYNRYYMVSDLQSIINTERPDHIFTTAEFDNNDDHVTTNQLVTDALAAVIAGAPTYNPTIHRALVHTEHTWPNALDASAYFTETTDLPESGPYWTDRESIQVPVVMQKTRNLLNQKFLAVAANSSQSGSFAFLMSFVHKDEIFWTKKAQEGNQPPVPNSGTDQTVSEGATVTLDGSGSFDPDADALTYTWLQTGGSAVTLNNANTVSPSFTAPSGLTANATLTFTLVVNDTHSSSIPAPVNVVVTATNPSPSDNIAPLATVTASSENTVDNQQAIKAVDTYLDGYGSYPGVTTREWTSTYEQTTGQWIQLNWPTPHIVNRIILYDRPNSTDQITSATLYFSDESSVTVGPLDNFGGGYEYVLPEAKTITSVRMTVDSVSGSTTRTGLAEIEVYCTQTHYTLAVTKAGTGSGTVSGSGIDCGSTCSVSYDYNTSVTLTATPAAGSTFTGWSGSGCSGTGSCTVTMSAARDVTATFTIDTFTVTPSAGLHGSLSPGSPQTVNYGATTSFTVTPDTGYHIASVTGCGGSLAGSAYTTGTITGDCTVTASFAIDTFTLTYTAGSNGSISGSSPQTVNYGASGSAVTAVPATGYHFVNWSDSSTANPRTDSNVTANISVTANFAIDTFTVTPSAGLHGSLSPSSPQTVNYGATTSFTVTPDTGYHIASVTGCEGSLAGSTFTTGAINDDCTVTATFNQTCSVYQIYNTNKHTYHITVQDAYNNADDGNSLLVNAYDFSGDLLLNRWSVNISLFGGYNCEFTEKTDFTTLNGNVTINNGSLTVDRLLIK